MKLTNLPLNSSTLSFRPDASRNPRDLTLAWLVVACVVLSGCTGLSPADQRLVSKPNMTFDENAVFDDRSTLIVQVEPGSAFSGGAQAGGCTSCK